MNHTPKEEAFVTLKRLSSDVQWLLGDYFVGFIVHGSLAGGDFAPQRSDVDFLVVTTAVLPSSTMKLIGSFNDTSFAKKGLLWPVHRQKP